MINIKVTYIDKTIFLCEYSKKGLNELLFIAENSSNIVSIEIF